MAVESWTTRSPSRITGTRPCDGCGSLSFSVKRHGTVSTSSPLWASAMRARQQNGLKRRSASAPARSYIVIAMRSLPAPCSGGHYAACGPRSTMAGGISAWHEACGRRRTSSPASARRMPHDHGFTEDQKQYLSGFITALAEKHGNPAPKEAASSEQLADATGARRQTDPTIIHIEAQNRAIAAGGALPPEEPAKRDNHPLDMWDEIAANAAAARFPKGLDIFRHKFHGLFYTAPNDDSFMLRLRIPGGILSAHQADGLAEVAERFGRRCLDLTTRANVQIRGIGPGPSLGAGADNIRNLTGSATAGIDPQELIDTRPLTRALHHHILNHRELYGLPRKFNIAFDGGGRLAVLEDTNDIGFAAVQVATGKPVPPGIYFRMLLGGVTGHETFARDSGVLLAPHEAVPAAVAIVRVFIDHGDRTDRKKARLKYLIDRWGMRKLLDEAARHLPFPWRSAPAEWCEPRGPIDKHGHIGVHPQAQPGRCYVGVVLPAGRLQAPQVRGLADIARRRGSGTLRLTVWQNLLISDIPEGDIPDAVAEIEAVGLAAAASAVRGGLVACTGNAGCRFARADTKRDALALAEHLDSRIGIDQPINIHLTGCPNSCAQHYVGDIGLLATRIDPGGDAEEIEGYQISVGGGSGPELALGRPLYDAVAVEELPQRLEVMLRSYLAHRRPQESFHAFANRHSVEALLAMFGADGGSA